MTFGLCVEPGPLELQALMCARSIRACGGAMADAPVVMVSPRGRPFSAAVRPLLEELDCQLVVETLNVKYQQYGLANKPFAAAWIADRVQTQLWFLDCDTLIAADPSPLVTCLATRSDTILRCVWTQGFEGVGSYGPDDPNDSFWMDAYALCGARHEPFIDVPWSDRRIRGYWNAGVILSRDRDLFHEWLRCFQLLFDSPLVVANPIFQEQVALALAMARLGLSTTSFPGVNVGLSHIAQVPAGALFIIHYAGPEQKQMLARDDRGTLLFATSGLTAHACGQAVVAVVETAMSDYRRALDGRTP